MKANFIVSPYTKNWIPGSESIFLTDPYMLHALEKSGEDKNYKEIKIAPSSRATREELIRDHNFVDEKYHKYIPILAKRLNHIHGTQHSEFFWKKALSLSLIRYITLFYDLFQVCESHFSADKHDCMILSEESYYIPNDFNDHREFFQCTAYGQEQIFSIYIYSMLGKDYKLLNDRFSWPDFQKGLVKVSAFKKVVNKIRRITLKKIILRILHRYLRFKSPKMIVFESFFSERHMDDLFTESGGLIQSVAIDACIIPFASEIDIEKRKLLSQADSSFDRFDRFFFDSLKFSMPKLFVEDFSRVTDFYQDYFRSFKDLKFIVNESWIGNTYSAIAIAGLQRRGIFHICNEHNYLSHQFLCNNNKYIYPLVDKFLTLGWYQDLSCKLAKGSSLREWVVPGNFFKEHEILFISGGPAVKVPEFNAAYGDFGGFNASNHLTFNMKFFERLDAWVIQKIVFRGYPVDDLTVAHVKPPMYAYDQEYVYKKYMDEFKLIDAQSRSAKLLMQKSRLVVVDYLSTSYLESLFADIPTIFFWNQNNYYFNELNSDFFKLLIEVGICHVCPKSAAEFVNKIQNNPEQWWNQEATKAARSQFLKANFEDPNYLKKCLVHMANN